MSGGVWGKWGEDVVGDGRSGLASWRLDQCAASPMLIGTLGLGSASGC